MRLFLYMAGGLLCCVSMHAWAVPLRRDPFRPLTRAVHTELPLATMRIGGQNAQWYNFFAHNDGVRVTGR